MLKKWTAFLVTVVLVAGTIFVSAEDENSTYSALVFIDDPFVNRLMEYEGMTAGQVESFMDDIDDFIASFKENIYESDADTIFITILLQVMQREEHLPVMVAFDAMFPEEIAYMLQYRKVPEVMGNFMDVAMRRKIIIEVGPARTEEPQEPEPTPTTQPEEEKSKYFDDMADYKYAVKAVDAMAQRGMIRGTQERCFLPGANITREEFTKLVVSALLETNDVYTKEYFKDPSGAWYEPYIAAGEFYGLSFGYYEWPYELEKPITREEMVTVAYRAVRRAGLQLPDIKYPTHFDDMYQIKYYAVEAINELQKANIISGVGNNKFEPAGETNRADAALLLYKLLLLKDN